MISPTVTIRTDAQTVKWWREQKWGWGERGVALRVAMRLLRGRLDGGESLEDLDRKYR
jgi:hypothetical protein